MGNLGLLTGVKGQVPTVFERHVRRAFVFQGGVSFKPSFGENSFGKPCRLENSIS